MSHQIIIENEFKYVETTPGKPVLMLLHGLFGALSNFNDLINKFSKEYNVVVPIMPLYEMPLLNMGLGYLLEYIEKFVEYKNFDAVHLLGNSLGGHITLLYVIKHPERVKTMILTGSSGLFENSLGTTFPRRGDYEFIKNKTASTFYDPEIATQELVDEVFGIVNDRNKVIRVIGTAKSAVRHNIGDKLDTIKVPTLLIWGSNDSITPPFVAEQFNELIENSELHFIDKCGHAPMMENPEEFNEILYAFLKKH